MPHKHCTRAFTLIAILTALIAITACGRKGDLIIPGTVLAQAPSGFQASPRGDGIILSFTMPDKDTSGDALSGLAGFKVLRAELPAGQEICPCRFESVAYIDLEFPNGAIVKDRKIAWLDPVAGLVTGKRYVYKVSGVDRDGYAGLESAQAVVMLLAAPDAPSGLTASPGKNKVALLWKPVTKETTGAPVDGLAGYDIYRSLEPGEFAGAPINQKPVQDTSYTDTGLVNGTVYYYRVSALRGAAPPFTEGAQSDGVSARPADTEPPAVPAGLQAVPGDGSVSLSWDPDMEEDLAGYYVYSKAPGGEGLKRLNDAPTDRITYKDADVKPGLEYSYAVTAVDNAVPPNESGRSGEISVKVP